MTDALANGRSSNIKEQTEFGVNVTDNTEENPFYNAESTAASFPMYYDENEKLGSYKINDTFLELTFGNTSAEILFSNETIMHIIQHANRTQKLR